MPVFVIFTPRNGSGKPFYKEYFEAKQFLYKFGIMAVSFMIFAYVLALFSLSYHTLEYIRGSLSYFCFYLEVQSRYT
jgi:small neutral amino acid transporter SnatA (MarC family)